MPSIKTRADVTPEICRELLRYEEETGKLFWKPRSAEWFEDGLHNRVYRTAEQRAETWNKRYAGKETFNTINDQGYLVGPIQTVRGRRDLMFKAHRVIWMIAHGKIPDGEIAHRDEDRSNNRLSNLYEIPLGQSRRNVRRRRNNSSGVTGVCWHKKAKRWKADIWFEGRQIWLGTFDDIEDAKRVRREAEKKYGYGPVHGLERI